MKRYFYLFFIFLFGLFSIIFIDNSISASSSDAYLIMTNPAEDSNSSITITWHTLIEGTFVEYTLKEDTTFTNSIKVDGEYKSLTIYDGTSKANVTDYKCYATLTNLQSDTEYIYRVGKTNMSEVHHFKTGGTANFNFAVVGDIHVYSSLASRLSKAETLIEDMNSKANLSFVLAVGDTMAYGTNRGYWDDLCNSKIIEKYMFVSTPGNHDYYNSSATFLDASYYNAYTQNPDNGPNNMKNTAYYFYYNDILFISLNSEDACTNESKKNAQAKWLEEVLKNNNSNFTVVYFHRSMYPGSGGNTGHAKTMKGAYQSLFDKYGVDLVFGGHDHVYVRTNKILNGTTSDSSLFGTTYISLPQIGDRVNSANSDYTDVAKKFGGLSGGVLFQATEDTLSFQLYNDAGEMLDGGAIFSKMSSLDQKKLDRYTKISYEEKFSNMKLDIYEGLFQRAINIKLYDGEKAVLDFRPEYNKIRYDIPNVSDVALKKDYKLVISYRDGTSYEKEFNIENKDLNITFSHDDISCFVNDELNIDIKNSLDMQFNYTYQYDDEYLEYQDGKWTAKKVGNTKIVASTPEIPNAIEINVDIKELPKIKVNYQLDGGVYADQVSEFEYGESIELTAPTKEGYNFMGWYLDQEYTTLFVNGVYEEDITVYAKWEKIEEVKSGCNKAALLFNSLLLLGLFVIRKRKY